MYHVFAFLYRFWGVQALLGKFATILAFLEKLLPVTFCIFLLCLPLLFRQFPRTPPFPLHLLREVVSVFFAACPVLLSMTFRVLAHIHPCLRAYGMLVSCQRILLAAMHTMMLVRQRRHIYLVGHTRRYIRRYMTRYCIRSFRIGMYDEIGFAPLVNFHSTHPSYPIRMKPRNQPVDLLRGK